MFKRTTAQIVINMNQLDLFMEILPFSMVRPQNKAHNSLYLMSIKNLSSKSNEKLALIKFTGIIKDDLNRLISKLNKYGVMVYA